MSFAFPKIIILRHKLASDHFSGLAPKQQEVYHDKLS